LLVLLSPPGGARRARVRVVVCVVCVLIGAGIVALSVALGVALLRRQAPAQQQPDADGEGFGVWAGATDPTAGGPDEWRADMDTLRRLRASAVRAVPFARTVRLYPGACSYTDVKSRIYLRLRDASGRPFPDRLLLLALLHELAHMSLSHAEQGPDPHGPPFVRRLSEFLTRARDAGLDVAAEAEVPVAYLRGCGPH
jgi:hypothetical protein